MPYKNNMPYKVRETEHNFQHLNAKLLGRYFKVPPPDAEVYQDDTFAKIWENADEVINLSLDKIKKKEEQHRKIITNNLVKAFAPLAKYC